MCWPLKEEVRPESSLLSFVKLKLLQIPLAVDSKRSSQGLCRSMLGLSSMPLGSPSRAWAWVEADLGESPALLLIAVASGPHGPRQALVFSQVASG